MRGLKGSLYEGGVRVPLIVHWPGRVAAGQVSSFRTGFDDWLPTMLDLVGAGDRTPKGIDGRNIASVLLGRPQKQRESLYREFAGLWGTTGRLVGAL